MFDFYPEWFNEINKIAIFLRWAEIHLIQEDAYPEDLRLQLQDISKIFNQNLIEIKRAQISEEDERGIINNLMDLYKHQFPKPIKLLVQKFPELRSAREILETSTLKPEPRKRPLHYRDGSNIRESFKSYLKAAIDQKESAGRYANHFLIGKNDNSELPRNQPIKSGDVFRIRIDIGDIKDTATEEDVPIPEELLPDGPLELDIMLSSTDFEVNVDPSFELQTNHNIAIGKMTLPDDGGPAKTLDDNEYLYFYLKAPDFPTTARARIGYYYRNHLVQCFLLTASIGEKEGVYSFLVDYTLSENYSNLNPLADLPERDHISIFTNDNNNGERTLVVKADGTNGDSNMCVYKLKESAINSIMENLRDTVYSEIGFSKKDLINGRSLNRMRKDLEKLAEIGWSLFSTVSSDCMRTWLKRNQESKRVLIDVTRPKEHTYSFPWQFFYDIPLIEGGERTFCKVIHELEEIISEKPSIYKCPHEKDHQFDILCPFGFWGFRFRIQQHAGKGKEPYLNILLGNEIEMLVANTTDVKSIEDLGSHLKNLKATMERKGGRVTNKVKKLEVLESMGNPNLPLIYFYCHGYRTKGYESTTYLSVGENGKITVEDFGAYYDLWYSQYGLQEYKKKTKPLVFINACHSIEINPDTLGSFLESFMERQFASGIIGTEVSVDRMLAMDFANKFYSKFINEGKSVGAAIHETRISYLAQNSLFGLIYTPYCFDKLTLE
ncbi:MAG: CHAT domain-containing protein [bacterium]|nr:MAG: CHAT domain-containing protein [bacterium]